MVTASQASMRAVFFVIRTLNKWVLGASALLVLVAFWNRNDLPRNIAFRTELQDAPQQTRTADPPFTVDSAEPTAAREGRGWGGLGVKSTGRTRGRRPGAFQPEPDS